MQVAELNLPARFAAATHFSKAYGAAHTAADKLTRITTDDGKLKPDTTREDSRAVVKSLQEALCAARALDNILAGNPPPRRGD